MRETGSTTRTFDHLGFWEGFYAGGDSVAVPKEPSSFARWVHSVIPSPSAVVEFGCGTGRDSLWLAEQGHEVIGIDFAEPAIAEADVQSRRRDLPAEFYVTDLYEPDDVAFAAQEIDRLHATPIIYARFLLHSLEDAGRWNLWQLARFALRERGALYLEFRTNRDQDAEHLFGDDHYRQFLNPTKIAAEIVEHGGTITHQEAGYGLAVYKSEDPHVARMVARWSPDGSQ